GVAHDLNNPLASVVGFSDFLVEAGEVPSSLAEPLQVIRQEAERAANIVKNLLSFARSQEGERKLQHIKPILESTLELLRNQLMAHKVEATLEVEAGLPEVEVNGNQIKQVFVNVINNACQAVAGDAASGRIWIAARRARDGLAVSVTDSGPGMTEAIAARVFEPVLTTTGVGAGAGRGVRSDHLRPPDAPPLGTRHVREARPPGPPRGRADHLRHGRHGAWRYAAVPGNAGPPLPPQAVHAGRAAQRPRPRRPAAG